MCFWKNFVSISTEFVFLTVLVIYFFFLFRLTTINFCKIHFEIENLIALNWNICHFTFKQISSVESIIRSLVSVSQLLSFTTRWNSEIILTNFNISKCFFSHSHGSWIRRVFFLVSTKSAWPHLRIASSVVRIVLVNETYSKLIIFERKTIVLIRFNFNFFLRGFFVCVFDRFDYIDHNLFVDI